MLHFLNLSVSGLQTSFLWSCLIKSFLMPALFQTNLYTPLNLISLIKKDCNVHFYTATFSSPSPNFFKLFFKFTSLFLLLCSLFFFFLNYYCYLPSVWKSHHCIICLFSSWNLFQHCGLLNHFLICLYILPSMVLNEERSKAFFMWVHINKFSRLFYVKPYQLTSLAVTFMLTQTKLADHCHLAKNKFVSS